MNTLKDLRWVIFCVLLVAWPAASHGRDLQAQAQPSPTPTVAATPITSLIFAKHVNSDTTFAIDQACMEPEYPTHVLAYNVVLSNPKPTPTPELHLYGCPYDGNEIYKIRTQNQVQNGLQFDEPVVIQNEDGCNVSLDLKPKGWGPLIIQDTESLSATLTNIVPKMNGSVIANDGPAGIFVEFDSEHKNYAYMPAKCVNRFEHGSAWHTLRVAGYGNVTVHFMMW